MPKLNIEGHTVSVDDSFDKLTPQQQNDTVEEIAASLKLTKSTPEQSSGMFDNTGKALLHGASSVVSGVGKTVKDYIAPETGKAIESAGDSIAPSNYKPAGEEFAKTLSPSLIPRGITEALPGMSADVIAGLAGKALLGRFGALAGPAASYMARTAGSNAEARAANNGRTEPSTGDLVGGALTSGAGAAVNQIGVGRLVNPTQVAGTGLKGLGQSAGNFLKAGAAAGASGVASDAVDQVGQSIGTDEGLTIDPRQALASGIMSAGAGAVHAGPRAIKDLTGSVTMRGANEHPEAASAVANRMVEKAGGSTDALGSPKQAFTALRDTQSDIVTELRAAKKGLQLSTEARNALDRANTKQALTPEDISAVDALGNSQVSDLVKQANAVAKLKEMGSYSTSNKRFAGGVSEMVRNGVTNRLGTALGATGGLGIVSGLTGGATAGTAAAAIPGFLKLAGTGLAAYTVLRKIEKGFGTGAPARTFAEKFVDPNQPMRQGAPQAAAPQAPAEQQAPMPQVPPGGIRAQALAKMMAPKADEGAAPKASRFDDYPEAPWALENSGDAARMALDESIRLGGTIHHPDGYMRGVARRVDGTEKAFDTLAKKITGPDQSIVEEALAKMKAVRSPEQAKEFREAFKEKLPAHQEVIDKTLSDDWIKSVWTSKKKK